MPPLHLYVSDDVAETVKSRGEIHSDSLGVGPSFLTSR